MGGKESVENFQSSGQGRPVLGSTVFLVPQGQKLGIIFDSFFPHAKFIRKSISIFKVFPRSDSCHRVHPTTLVHASSTGKLRTLTVTKVE